MRSKNLKAILFTIFLLQVCCLLSQGIESFHHIEIKDKGLVPEKAPEQVFLLDFANADSKWADIENHENKIVMGLGEKLGQRGFFLMGPDTPKEGLKKSSDTAWQLRSVQFSVQGMTKLSGVIDFYSNCAFTGYFAPYRENYVNSIYWFADNGSSLGRTAFPVSIKEIGHNPVAFRVVVPERAARASIALGADSPNLKAGDILLISRVTVGGMPVHGGTYCTDGEVTMPPIRYAPGKPICTFIADMPEGTAVIAETAFSPDKGGAPAEFSPFGSNDQPVPKGTAWVKCRLKFQTNGISCPMLRSVTICGRTIACWASLTAEKNVVIRRKEDIAKTQGQKISAVRLPVIRRTSQSPSPDPTQAFIFSVTHDMPINWRTLKVIIDGQDITTKLTRAELGFPPPTLESVSFTYAPAEPFAMRTVHKAVVTICDIYGTVANTNLYFFFDAPLEKNVVTLRDDGGLLVDGKPFFPICASYVIPLPENGNSLDNAYSWLRETGFNTIIANPAFVMKQGGRDNFKENFKAYMDKAAEYGLKTYFPPGNTGGGNCKDTDAILSTIVRYYRHPAVLTWYIGDDTLTHNTPEEMKMKIEAIKAVDPYHPTCQADAVFSFYPSIFAPVATEDDASRYRPVVNFTDIFRAELYPVRNYSEQNSRDCVPSVIADMRTILRDIRDKATTPKNIWGIVQYFEGWCRANEEPEWKRFPTWQELRAMTWATLIHNARAINWYTYHYNKDKFAHGFMYKAETRRNIQRILQEIVPLVDVLVERADGPTPTVTILEGPATDVLKNDSISVMVRRHDGFTYLFAVNSAYKPVRARISAPGLSSGTVLYEDNRSITVVDGFVTDVFQPNEVHIYKLN
ncbi:MAG: hypothetical protein J6X55_06970 [Victivallales bacterium]|nr:hypothetical protein [Victivallales bacterium]